MTRLFMAANNSSGVSETGLTYFLLDDLWSMSLTAGLWLIASIIVWALQNRRNKRATDVIRDYTRTEYFLLKHNKITTDDMLTYHGNVNWANYAGFSFTALFVSISLIKVEGKVGELLSKEIIAMSILLTSAVIMALVDRIFTNNLSKFVPINTRFRVTNLCVTWGVIAFFLNLLAIAIYFSKFHPWYAPAVVSILFVGAYLAGRTRSIPFADIKEAYDLSEEEVVEIKRVLKAKKNPWMANTTSKKAAKDKKILVIKKKKSVKKVK